MLVQWGPGDPVPSGHSQAAHLFGGATPSRTPQALHLIRGVLHRAVSMGWVQADLPDRIDAPRQHKYTSKTQASIFCTVAYEALVLK